MIASTRSFRASIVFCALTFFGVPAFAADWQVTLTAEQNQKFLETKTKPKHSVMAISPDSAWGRTWGYNSLDEAKTNALGFCRENLRKRHRDCLIFAIDGKVVVGAVAKTKIVSQVYRPVSGKKAAAHFGLRAINFQGNVASARAQFQTIKANPNAIKSLPVSKQLGAQLLGSSIVLNSGSGFSVALTAYGARQATKANSGVLVINFDDWTITPDGLLCMMNGFWKSSGKRVGTKCMVLESIKAGKLRFAWDGSINTMRKGMIVAGDAGRGAAK